MMSQIDTTINLETAFDSVWNIEYDKTAEYVEVELSEK